MDALKKVKKLQKINLTNAVFSTEEMLRSILTDVTKFKNDLPSDFNQIIPTAYFYEFLLNCYKKIFDEKK